MDMLLSYGSRIKLLHQANQGPEVARNLGASRSDAEYLAFLDSDDLFLPRALETYDKLIEVYNSPPLILGSMTYFKEGDPIGNPADQGTAIEVLKYEDFLSKDTAVGMSSSKIVIRRKIFEEAGGLRRSTPTTFHLDDYNLMLRTGTYGPCIIVQTPTTVAYRSHSANSIRDTKAMVSGILALIHAEGRGEYPGGRHRRFARYACIGGPAIQWGRRSLKTRRLFFILNFLMRATPMIAASVLKKVWIRFRGTQSSIILNA